MTAGWITREASVVANRTHYPRRCPRLRFFVKPVLRDGISTKIRLRTFGVPHVVRFGTGPVNEACHPTVRPRASESPGHPPVLRCGFVAATPAATSLAPSAMRRAGGGLGEGTAAHSLSRRLGVRQAREGPRKVPRIGWSCRVSGNAQRGNAPRRRIPETGARPYVWQRVRRTTGAGQGGRLGRSWTILSSGPRLRSSNASLNSHFDRDRPSPEY